MIALALLYNNWLWPLKSSRHSQVLFFGGSHNNNTGFGNDRDTIYLVFSRPGQSQGLLYKHFCDYLTIH